MKESLRNVISEVQHMELEGYEHITFKKFAAKVTEIFQLMVYNLRKTEFNKKLMMWILTSFSLGIIVSRFLRLFRITLTEYIKVML